MAQGQNHVVPYILGTNICRSEFKYDLTCMSPMGLRIVKLFAGVGGFRIGFEGNPGEAKNGHSVIWSNQWEPSTKTQHASDIYVERWNLERNHEDFEIFTGKEEIHVNKDISTISEDDIPDHDLLWRVSLSGLFCCKNTRQI